MNLALLERVAGDLRTALADYEPERITGADAARMLQGFAEIERLGAAGKLLSARRVESSNIWRQTGHRSAAAHLAEATGSGIGPAISALETARRLGSLPATDDALRGGRLSETQAKEISGAAILQPETERELVEAAGQQSLAVLKLRCRRVKAAGADQKAAYDRIHNSRYLRNWVDPDGAVRFDAKLTPDAGARLLAVVKVETARLTTAARRVGADDTPTGLAADALVGLATGGSAASVPGEQGDSRIGGEDGGPSRRGGGPAAMVHVRVDHAALRRGHVEPGEVCEIPGIGPIPVEVARQLATDSILSVLLTDGVDVTSVAHVGRTIPAALRTALVERDPVCVVPSCEVSEGLEIDHVRPFAEGGPTALHNLARLCHWHHYLKTHRGYDLVPEPDGWSFRPPGSG